MHPHPCRCTELPPAGPEEGAQQQRPGAPQRQQRGAGLSRVPDHVTHPERYTCYVLDEPLVVGGGVGQLAGGQHNRLDAAGAAAAEGAQGDEPEPERWSGPVGVAGAVQFKPRQERAGGGAAAAPGGGQGGGPAAPKGRLGAVQLQAAYEDEAGEGEAGEDAAMEAAAAGPRPAAAARAKQRQYRNTRAADMDAE